MSDVTVNEDLPENHPAHVTDFGDIRDEAHMPPGNTTAQPVPTQDELLEANEAAETVVVGDASVTDEEDLLIEPHQGSSSWYSDPDAVSSDPTQAAAPGYEVEEEQEEEVEAGGDDGESFHATDHTVADVEAYAQANPDEIGRLLEEENASGNPRSSLVTKLEGMTV